MRTSNVNAIAVGARFETPIRLFVIDGFGELRILIGQLDLTNI